MDTKINARELFFQLKNKKQKQTRSFDKGLFSLGIHQELKTALIPVAACNGKKNIKSGI